MTIEQKFHDYCDGCPFMDVQHRKDGARTATGEMELFRNFITCENYSLCARLWDRISTMKQAGK